MKCPVCAAPAVGTRCLFCHADLAVSPGPDAQELIDFLAGSISGAAAHRGAFDRGPIRAVELPGGFSARLHKGQLELGPARAVEEWLALLLGDLRLRAQSDFEVRSAMTSRGWALS